MKRLLVFAALSAVLGLAASGCHNPSDNSPGNPVNSQAGPPSPGTQSSPTTPPASPPAKVVVYVINPKATGDQDLLMPQTIALRHPEAPAKDALNALLEAKHSPLAPRTALRGLSVDSGLATLDFSQNPVNTTGGESAQSAALNALAMTLGQFPEINTYQIQVKGKLVKAFGEFSTDGPMEVTRPGAELQAASPKPLAEGSGQ